MSHRIRSLGVALLIAAWPSLSTPAPAADQPGYVQAPEIMPSQVKGAPSTAAPARPADIGLNRGPAPSWIWGPADESKYILKTSFIGGSTAAVLKTACDNQVTIFLNGKQVASNDDWQEPVESDVQAEIKPGGNDLVAMVENQGGPAGFIFKLALKNPDGTVRYVVSDASWTASRSRNAKTTTPARVIATHGQGAWGDAFDRPSTVASQRGIFELPAGFKIERLFTVPRDELGSWVSLTFDLKGRLIVSDEGKNGLCRVTPPPLSGKGDTKVERLSAPVSGAMGLVVGFDSLYVNGRGQKGTGLYRLRDTDNDDQYDQVSFLKQIRGSGEHGPHGLRITPDGKSIMMVAGNHTLPPEGFQSSLVPSNWSEDQLLPRQWDANGHARGILAPGGWIAKTDPEGKTWQIFSSGYRNSYDIAFNAEGELFAYDSDMEWDMGMPWYRPTRAVHATSGSELGWRSGTGKWPAYYVDSIPPLLNIGPGSPVGVTFGYGAKFPARYQKALYLCDWTFGTIYALHLEPEGSTYKATKEEFVSRTPLPLTDAAIGPDGAFYFTIGGRGTQSELFRVTYIGDESTTAADLTDPRMLDLRDLRRSIEKFHHAKATDEQIASLLYPNLAHPDRFIRYAARVALEHQPVSLWQEKVLAETDPETLITGAVALAHQGDKSLEPKLIAALSKIQPSSLPEPQQLELLRAWSLVFIRMGAPDAPTASRLAHELGAYYPAPSDSLNRELCILLVYLKSPDVVSKTMDLLRRPDAAPAESLSELLARNPGYGGSIARMLASRPDAQKLHYGFVLRNATVGWTLPLRKEYFGFLRRAHTWNGGASFQGFLNNIEKDAYENASDSERLAIEATGLRTPYKAPALPQPHGPGKAWSIDEIVAKAGSKMRSGRDFENGKRTFAASRCIVCHRFSGEGGATGPDLTQAAGRFGVKDLAEAIIEPSRVISDQYRMSLIETDAGEVVKGRVVSESGDSLIVVTDPEDSSKVAEINKKSIEAIKPSPVSLMPEKLLEPLNETEVFDLLAYLLSRGDATDAMFRSR